LRAHKEDLPLLVDELLAQLSSRHGGQARHGQTMRVSREAMGILRQYDWPGNVRELRNALERALVLCRGDEIGPGDLPGEVRENQAGTGRAQGSAGNSFLSEADFREAKRKFEIAYLKRKLEEHKWNVSQTAAEIGLQRQSLQEKLRELGIQRPGKG
jgi:two-component system nitrogen regulation response regulator NtrX